MEIRSEITDERGSKIVITSSNVNAHQNYLKAFDTSTQTVQAPTMQQKPVLQPPERSVISDIMKRHMFSDIELKQIRQLRREGTSIKDISKIMNRPYGSVWARASKVKPTPQKTEEKLVAQLRKRHAEKTPSYHVDCPCMPMCTATVADYLTRAKAARTTRLLKYTNDKNSRK